MSYTKQIWDTTSYVNPTRMNHIEDGIKENSDNINSPAFTEAATRANINSGESLFTILGKIKKFFTDLKAVAFSGSASDVVMSDGVTSVESKLNGIIKYDQVVVSSSTISAGETKEVVAPNERHYISCEFIADPSSTNAILAGCPVKKGTRTLMNLMNIYTVALTTSGYVRFYYLDV